MSANGFTDHRRGLRGRGRPLLCFLKVVCPPPPLKKRRKKKKQTNNKNKHNSCSHVYRAITVSLSPRTQRKGQKSQRFLGQSMSLRSGLWSQYQSSVVVCQAVGPAGMSDLVLLYPLSYLPLYPRALVCP